MPLAADALTPMQAELVKRWRLKRFRLRFLRLCLGLAAVGLLYWAMTPFAMLGWNVTDSLPGRVYLIVKVQRPAVGDKVAFYPPPTPYYPANVFFTKILIGQAGDVVSHQGRDVFLNGKKIGTALDFDSSRHRPLHMAPAGVIPAGHYFVWTPHPRSYDSRYADIGLVSDAQILGRAYRLL